MSLYLDHDSNPWPINLQWQTPRLSGSSPDSWQRLGFPPWKNIPKPTWDVGGDLSQSRLAKSFAGPCPHWEKVCGARMQVGEDVVRFVPELEYGAPWTRHVDGGVRRFNALVADLEWRDVFYDHASQTFSWEEVSVSNLGRAETGDNLEKECREILRKSEKLLSG